MSNGVKDNIINYLSNGPRTIFFSVLVIMCLILVLSSSKKEIIISVDGNAKQVKTYSSNIEKILNQNDIVIGPKDKIMPSLDTKVKDGDKISIKKAVNIKVLVDGKQLKIKSAEDSVGKMLSKEGIKLNKEDKTSLSKKDKLKEGMEIIITRVTSKIVKENQIIDFATVTKKDNNMIMGNNKIIQEGRYGNKEITTKVIYEDGKEVSRQVIKEVVTQKPINKVVATGTLGALTLSRGGQLLYTKSIKVKATAYSPHYASTGKNPGDKAYGITATGKRARRCSNGYSSIAVDPNVIPFGTKLYVPGYGCAIAEDVGGAIKGNTIDVFFNSESEAINWGVKWIPVYILK